MKRYRVTRAMQLRALLEEVFDDRAALAEGRVFVNRVRMRDDRPLTPNDEIEVGARARDTDLQTPTLLHRSHDFIVVEKPAGLASIPDHHGQQSLQTWVAEQLELPAERVHPTSRLDRLVSGVVVFALTKRAREQLVEARTEHAYLRRYLAISAHAPQPAEGVWTFSIGRDRDPRRRKVNGARAVPASSGYRTLATCAEGTLLMLEPHTGRTHQLRVHAAHVGSPLDGDASYGGRTRWVSASGEVHTLARIALHALLVEFPWDGRLQRFFAPPPPFFLHLWQTLGGPPEALPRSPSDALTSPEACAR